MGRIAEAIVGQALESYNQDTRVYDQLTCQCCGHTRKLPTDLECICDGTAWHMLPNGEVECEPHRFARAMGHGKRSFAFWRKR